MHFADRLLKKISERSNSVCIGIDPNIDSLPVFLRSGDVCEAIRTFSKQIIDAVSDLVPSVKLQSAYFEMYGAAGVAVFEELIAYARQKGLSVIADVKRGDIGSTAAAYAAGYLKDSGFNADAITVTPYMGVDSVEPFVTEAILNERGIFVLVKTSNPGSADVQDLRVDAQTLYEHVADLVKLLGVSSIGESGYSCVGAVVGATFPKQLKDLRTQMPQQIFLVPGYGAQGAGAGDIVGAFDQNKTGALIVAARSVIYAYKNHPERDEKEFAACAREAVGEMVVEIQNALK